MGGRLKNLRFGDFFSLFPIVKKQLVPFLRVLRQGYVRWWVLLLGSLWLKL